MRYGNAAAVDRRAARGVGRPLCLQQLRLAGGVVLRRAPRAPRHTRHPRAARGQRDGDGVRLHPGQFRPSGVAGAPGRRARSEPGTAHQHVAGQPARRRAHLRRRHGQLCRPHGTRPEPRLRSDRDLGAVHEGRLVGDGAGPPAARRRAGVEGREDSPGRPSAPRRLRPHPGHGPDTGSNRRRPHPRLARRPPRRRRRRGADEGAARLQAADDLRRRRRLEERRPVGAVGRRRALRRPDRRRLPAERPLFTPAELRPVSGGRASGRPGLRHRRRRTTPRTVVAERLRTVRRRRAHSRHRPRLQESARHPGYRPRHPG